MQKTHKTEVIHCESDPLYIKFIYSKPSSSGIQKYLLMGEKISYSTFHIQRELFIKFISYTELKFINNDSYENLFYNIIHYSLLRGKLLNLLNGTSEKWVRM